MAAQELQRQEPNACLFSFDKNLVKAAVSEGITSVNGNAIQDDPATVVAALKAVSKFTGDYSD
jgi:hypothetical protein